MASDQHQGCEDGPCSEVDTERVREQFGMVFICTQDVGTRDEHDSIREPETTVAGERGSAKGVSSPELPHTGQ